MDKLNLFTSKHICLFSAVIVILFSKVLIASEKENLHPDWMVNLEEAQNLAKEQNKSVMLYFSGSDWCRPCIQLKEEVFKSAEFANLAAEKLLLVQLDFPARKNNQLSNEQQHYNEEVAEAYNKKGHFPFVVLFDSNGKVLGKISGYQKEGAGTYLNKLKALF